jgi:ubiquinone/menaquinone biosynthesis C-methylase UbiE
MSDQAQLKARLQATWSAGDFAMVATMITIVGELLCETVDLRAGQDVLDVATGSGNTAIAAARRFTDVTGIDFVPALLDRARERSAVEGLQIDFREGDAEALPFPDASFDVVLSTFGVMFAPDHPKAAAEMLRVLRPGGRIGLANWVPDGTVGEMFRTVSKHVPPPPGLTPPVMWGTEDHLRKLFGEAGIELIPRTMRVVMPSVDFWLEFFRRWFGPTVKAFEAVGPAGAPALEADLKALAARHNVSGDETLVYPQAYVEVVITP